MLLSAQISMCKKKIPQLCPFILPFSVSINSGLNQGINVHEQMWPGVYFMYLMQHRSAEDDFHCITNSEKINKYLKKQTNKKSSLYQKEHDANVPQKIWIGGGKKRSTLTTVSV